MKPNKTFYNRGQSIEVEIWNAKTKQLEWIPGIFLNAISATDRSHRLEVEVNGRRYEGYDAAAPECVRPLNN